MNSLTLTPDEIDVIQMYYMKRYLAERCPVPGRRKRDAPLPEVCQHLSQSQLNRFCRWAASRERVRT